MQAAAPTKRGVTPGDIQDIVRAGGRALVGEETKEGEVGDIGASKIEEMESEADKKGIPKAPKKAPSKPAPASSKPNNRQQINHKVEGHIEVTAPPKVSHSRSHPE